MNVYAGQAQAQNQMNAWFLLRPDFAVSFWMAQKCILSLILAMLFSK